MFNKKIKEMKCDIHGHNVQTLERRGAVDHDATAYLKSTAMSWKAPQYLLCRASLTFSV